MQKNTGFEQFTLLTPRTQSAQDAVGHLVSLSEGEAKAELQKGRESSELSQPSGETQPEYQRRLSSNEVLPQGFPAVNNNRCTARRETPL